MTTEDRPVYVAKPDDPEGVETPQELVTLIIEFPGQGPLALNMRFNVESGMGEWIMNDMNKAASLAATVAKGTVQMLLHNVKINVDEMTVKLHNKIPLLLPPESMTRMRDGESN